jgi:hypothetical protein
MWSRSTVMLFGVLVVVMGSVPRHAACQECDQPLGERATLILEQVTEDGVVVDTAGYAGHTVFLTKFDANAFVDVYYEGDDASAWKETYK